MKRRIGLIGVGLMGHGIASSLMRNGWPLGFLEHAGNQPTGALVAGGASPYATARALTEASDVVILCVTGAPQVDEVIFAEDGVLTGLRESSVIVDCSTSLPATTRKVAEAVEKAGGRYLDAPMTRTPKEAAEGRLNLIVGGDADLFEAQRPLLQAFADQIAHVGPVGAGHAMKLLHNFVSLGFAAVLAEAAACAEKTGVDPGVFADVLAKGGGGGVVLERLRPYIENGDASGLRFSVANALKDTEYYEGMAKNASAAHSLATTVTALYGEAAAANFAERPVPELIDYLKR